MQQHAPSSASLIHVEVLIKEVLVNNWRKISSQPAGFCALRKQVYLEDTLRYIPQLSFVYSISKTHYKENATLNYTSVNFPWVPNAEQYYGLKWAFSVSLTPASSWDEVCPACLERGEMFILANLPLTAHWEESSNRLMWFFMPGLHHS